MPVDTASAPTTLPIATRWQPEPGPGAQLRIGLIVLATDQVTEHDLRLMAPDDAVGLYASRIANRNPTTLENLRAMADDLPRAAALILPDEQLDVIAFACTSGTVAMGAAPLVERIRQVRPGIPCTTPATAALVAFERLAVRRIVLLTPYVDEVNQAIRRYIEAAGVEVIAMASFDLASDADMARVPPAAIRSAAIELDRPEADAVFISCTALRAIGVIDQLEQALGKPVVTSHQALLWDAMRLAGRPLRRPGFGRLLLS